MSANPRKCVFCGRCAPDVKISKEHVLRRWLGEQLGQLGQLHSEVTWTQRYVDTQSGQTKELKRRLPHSAYETTVGDVCKQCNEGWMNERVEQPAGPLIVSLAQGRSLRVSKAQARSLALWAAKTAVVRALVDKGRRVVPDEDYRWMMQRLTPPRLNTIWILHSGAEPGDTFERHLRFTESDDETDFVRDGHETTLILGAMMLHVVGFSNHVGLMPVQQLDAVVQRAAHGAAVRLWPDPQSFSWAELSEIDPDSAADVTECVYRELRRRTEASNAQSATG